MFYDYICHECEIVKEVNHGMMEDPEILCEECGEIIKRIVTGGAGTHYKGHGWAGEQNKFKGAQSNVTKTSMKANINAVGER